MIRLEDVCDISSGGTPSRAKPQYYKGDIPWAKISDLENAADGILTITEEHISQEGLNSIGNRLFPKDTLLFAMYGSIGKVAITGTEVATNQAILGIRPKDDKKVYLPYLKAWFESNKQMLINQGRGVALQNLSATIIRNLRVPLPPIAKQVQIADVINKADVLIKRRKESIRLANDFLKSMFLEMFGDPRTNNKAWEVVTLSEAVAKDCPLTYGIVQPGNEFPNGVPVVRPIDLVHSVVKRTGLKLIDPNISAKFSRTILKGGELLMCVRGTTGVISTASQDLAGCNVTRGITPIRFNESFNSSFGLELLQSHSVQNRIQELTYGATLKQINLSEVRKIKLICPPIILQNQYGEIAERVKGLKGHFRHSLEEFENLRGGLSHRAFQLRR